MENAVLTSFPYARLTTDRFHVQCLVTEALQEMRVRLRWKAIEEENRAVKQVRQTAETAHARESTQTEIQKKTAPCQKSLSSFQTKFSMDRPSETTSGCFV